MMREPPLSLPIIILILPAIVVIVPTTCNKNNCQYIFKQVSLPRFFGAPKTNMNRQRFLNEFR